MGYSGARRGLAGGFGDVGGFSGLLGVDAKVDWIRTREPKSRWNEHERDRDADDFKRGTPANGARKIVHQERRNYAAETEAKIGVAHGLATATFEPFGDQHLV